MSMGILTDENGHEEQVRTQLAKASDVVDEIIVNSILLHLKNIRVDLNSEQLSEERLREWVERDTRAR